MKVIARCMLILLIGFSGMVYAMDIVKLGTSKQSLE